jgi:hypothetical protein
MSLGSGLALACCSIVAPPAASPYALSISKKIKTGVTWNLACLFEIKLLFHVVVSFGVARITFHVYVD